MKSIDGSHSCADVGALDIDVPLGTRLVHVDVHHSPVLVTLVDDVIADLLVTVGLPLVDWIEHDMLLSMKHWVAMGGRLDCSATAGCLTPPPATLTLDALASCTP